MFGEFLRRLTDPDPESLGPSDSRLALAALLIRLARADGDYAKIEIEKIDQLLSERYDLDAEQAHALRLEAEILEQEAPDTVRFTRAIKDAVPYEDRSSAVETLWKIVLVDGERDEVENSIMRMVAPMLGVNDRESALARQRATRKV